jgi:flagellar motor switch protein FliG
MKPVADNRFNGKQKAAVVMVALGADSAAKVYKSLKDEEVEQLTLDIATLPKLESEDLDNVLSEFYEMCLAQKYIIEGGVDYAKDILEKAFGMQNARNVIDKVIISIGSKAFDFMKKTDPKQLYNFIQNEHPQTIALILVHATRLQATNVLSFLPKEKQVEVIERIAKMDRTSPDTIKEVEAMLQKRISTIGAADVGDLGGVKYTAELLNSIDRSTEKFIFETLAKKDPELVDEIRKLMFVFEDITSLDDPAMQLLCRDLDTKDLVTALKTAGDEIKEMFFRNMSKRNAEQVKEDIEYARNIRSRDVEAAQQRIVAKIRELEEAGTIVVSRGGEDDIV